METTPKPKMKTWKKVLLGIVIGFFALMFIAVATTSKTSAGNSSTSNTDTTASTPATDNTHPATDPSIAVSAKQLFSDYDKNEVSADNQYKGKQLLVTGTVASINKDMTDGIYISLYIDDVNTVQCNMTDDSKSAAASLQKGQQITIAGTGDGMVISVPQIKDCTIK